MFDLVLGHTSFLGHTGYANHAREFFTALNDKVPVRVRNFAHCADLDYLTKTQRDMVVEQHWNTEPFSCGTPFKRPRDQQVVDLVLLETNHSYFYEDYPATKIAYNVWESTRQPEPFFKRLLEYDQLWVPTEWQRQCSVEQGYPAAHVKVVHEGVDGEVFKPGETADGRFRFLYFGRWDYRKATTEVVRAFVREFGNNPDVELVLSADNPFPVDGYGSTEERLEKYGLQASNIKVAHFPPFDQYVDYLRTGHAFLSCARAEGWNLPLLEAIACGTPAICSNYGAQLEFAKDVGHLVNIKEHRPPENVFMQENVPGTWAEPDFEHLQVVMREVYENWQAHRAQAVEVSERVREDFAWPKAAQQAYDVLAELSPLRPRADRVWLNVGCGERLEDSFTNIDLHHQSADAHMDALELGYDDNSAGLIQARHLLEHIGKHDTLTALREWMRVLCPGGQLQLWLPDLAHCMGEWLSGTVEQQTGFFLDRIYGHQAHEGEYHKTGFSKDILREWLQVAGYDDVMVRNTPNEPSEIHARAQKPNYGREVVVMGSFPDTPEKITVLRECYARLKAVQLPCVLVSHCPVPDELHELFEFVIYERENVLSNGWELSFWYDLPGVVKLVGKYGNATYQPVAILSSLHNALGCLRDKYDVAYYIESDTFLEMPRFVELCRDARLRGSKFSGFAYETPTAKGVTTNALSMDIGWALENLPKVRTWQDYLDVNQEMLSAGTHDGNAIFEAWLDGWLTHNGIRKQCAVFDVETRKAVVHRANVIKRDLPKGTKITLSETNDDRVVVFFLYSDEDATEPVECRVQYKGRVVSKQTLEPGKLAWCAVAKDQLPYEVYIDNEHVRTLELSPGKSFLDATFKLHDNSLVCKEWQGGEFGQPHEYVDARVSYLDGAMVDLRGGGKRAYEVRFVDKATGEMVHTDNISPGHWTKPNRQFFTDWHIEVRRDGEVVVEDRFDARGRRVFLKLGSNSLGDTLAWFPYCEEFARKHECQVVCTTFWNNLFRDAYPDIEFAEPGATVHNLYAALTVGCFDGDSFRNKRDWKTVSLQQLACDCLGLEYTGDLRPRVGVPEGAPGVDGPYVCLAEHSTAKCKYWNHPGGWQQVVDHCRQRGLEVVVPSKEPTMLRGVVDRTNEPIESTINTLRHAKVFVGVGSGLSWLAWALGVPVVLISGFSEPWYEFQDCARIINQDVCHGCFNDMQFDRGDWNWCPRGKDFECTKSISPKQVTDALADNLRVT